MLLNLPLLQHIWWHRGRQETKGTEIGTTCNKDLLPDLNQGHSRYATGAVTTQIRGARILIETKVRKSQPNSFYMNLFLE